MPNFIIFDSATGAILRRGICPEEHLDLQAMEGETALSVPAEVTAMPEINLAPLSFVVEQGARAQALQALLTPEEGND